ncbi:MAG: HisA/HisF-related TIM barrel protein [Gemmataceae bacterium]|nr:HisA/HisF-related TIM barrel protein [Gemmataceae bacterium]
MRILPVIDLMNGQVVRGVAGRRTEYKPIVSRLTTSTDPVDVALAFREHFGFHDLYIADLDAIAGMPAALPFYQRLARHGFRLWVDAGLRRAADAGALLECRVNTVVAGLETMDGPGVLADLVERVTPARLVFSLDLKNGRPLSDRSWRSGEPLDIAAEAVALGVQRLLVLDLAQVGVGAGVGTEALCRRLRGAHPHVELTAGGGVRGSADVEMMRRAGVSWLLIASALHDARIDRAGIAAVAAT